MPSYEAAKYVPVEQLSVSPECGFSSTVHGNAVAVEAQRAKLRLVVEVADEVGRALRGKTRRRARGRRPGNDVCYGWRGDRRMDDTAEDRTPRRRHAGALVVATLLAASACGGAAYYGLESRSRDHNSADPAPAAATVRARAEFGDAVAGDDARRLADWVVASADHRNRPFALVDKTQARLYIFAPSGRLIGASPVLLGLARGDDSEPGIGDKPIAQVRPEERTTPAGRFVSEPGKNLGGENVIWVDYDAAVSMHSVRANVKSERRLERLESPDPAEHRISYGCINVPAAFYASVAWPSFAEGGGMIYVLPETRPLVEVFPALRGSPAATSS